MASPTGVRPELGFRAILADFSRRDPRWKQILPSSELASSKRQWPVVPTHCHGGIDYGTIAPR